MADAKKTENVHLRLTPDEFALLKEQSERTGRSMSDLIRAAWKRMKIVELPPADFSETVVQLRRIGSDLGQLNRAANAGEINIPEIKSVLSEIASIDKRLTKILSGGGL
ncbi:MAG: ribbon-helix-helix protein, CopG family [Clostridia bacterium]|nr:ribbon-helix-helix protein, CopG family [Clostridia bacterium]